MYITICIDTSFQLLRSSLVNNRTQSIVCDDLGMYQYVIYAETRGESLDMKTKEKADLLEGEWLVMCFDSLFLAHLHFSAEELLLYPRLRRPRRRPRPHAKC